MSKISTTDSGSYQSALTEGISRTAHRNRYVILALVIVGSLMSVMDSNVVNIALPTMIHHFHASVADAEWIVTGYLMALTATLLIFGKASDYFGESRMFIAGFTVFTISSLACGLSASLEQLIVFRIVQALGAAMVFSISLSIPVRVFPKEERGRVLGLVAATAGLGMIVGPPLGGFIVDALGWNYIFFVNVPIGLLLVAAASRYMRLGERRSAKLTMDWPGAALLIVLVVSLILFLDELAKNAGFGVMQAVYGLIFLLSAALFAARELRCQEPVLDIRILGVRKFAMPTLSMVLVFSAIGILTFTLPFYFQGVFRWTPTQVGTFMLLVPVSLVAATPVSGWIYDKFGFRYLPSLGLLLMGIASLGFAYLLPAGNLLQLSVAMIVSGVGCGLFISPNNADIMGSLPRKPTMLSSVIATFRNLGSVLGASLASLFLSLELGTAGSAGAILQVGVPLLTSAVADAAYATGAICLVAAAVACLRS